MLAIELFAAIRGTDCCWPRPAKGSVEGGARYGAISRTEGRIMLMKILVLGGTWFLGRAVAQEALNRGWDVSTFNRGKSGAALEGTHKIHGDRTVAADLSRLAEHG
ncbi:NAD-dependent epimerase/dehydratase family protein [Streptomyces violascens]|nr:NAD-dependent epimerase/dehydratase family protein [Streptomyces violascens]